MHDIFERQEDPLEHLLAPPPSADAGPLRQDLLKRTTRALGNRRRLRRCAGALALAACAGAGLLTVHGVAPRGARPVVQRHPVERQERPAPVPAPSAVALEWQALEGPGRPAELYRQAGDRYLDEEGDPDSAVRCYGHALDAGGARDLAIAPEDSWLLMTIKAARQKEKDDAKQGG
jgi:hypothetical protein